MTDQTKAFISIAAVLTAFAFGRYSVPLTEKTETRTAAMEQTQTDITATAARDRHTDTVITETRKPDGTVEKRTEIKAETQTVTERSRQETDVASQVSDIKTEKTRQASQVHLSALAGFSVHDLTAPVYGGSVSKEVLGPISVGFWGLSSGVVGASVGVSL